MPVGSAWLSLEPYPKMPLSRMLEWSAARYPNKAALITADGQEYTFARIWMAARRIARLLEERGLARGDRVGILSPNCPEYGVVFHAILLAGGVATTLNPLYREREIEHQLNDSGAVALFHSRLHAPLIDAVRGQLPSVRHYFTIDDVWRLADVVTGEPYPVVIDPDHDLAALPYSSGTTGLPKGVKLTHFNLTSNIRQNLAVGLTDHYSVLLDFLPFFHIYGLSVLLNVGLAIGATQVIMPRFDLEQMFALIQKHRVSNLFVAPPAMLAMANLPDPSRFDTSSLNFILSGAAPMAPEVAQRVSAMFGCTVLQGYGLTETSPTTNVNPLRRIKPASVGPPISDTEEKVVHLETGEELPPGEVGELLIRGPQVMRGYWRQPEATAECMTEDGWLRSGDIASMDEEGYVYIHDRKKEMIKYKGYQVAPAELEALLLEHPQVRDAAVIPKRDAAAGEIPKAFVVLADGAAASPEELMAFVAERVAPYKKLRQVEFVDAIPKSLSGKILRRELIEKERAKEGG
ncbi:MAG TPA: AMP-binding protein [Dehalococcoidia bacterium]|nr:AMP-binding protein [Dehalococcoidia bacterium]